MTTVYEYYGVAPSAVTNTENRYRYLAVLGQTTFSASYSVGYVDVYYNGSDLDPAIDFTATDGLHIILTTPCVGGETIEIVSKIQVQNQDIYTKEQVNTLLSNYYGICTGSGDTQVVNTTPTFNSFSDGLEIKVRTSAANATTSPVITVNGLTALTIVRPDQTPLSAGAWGPNNDLTLRYIQANGNLALMDGSASVSAPAQFDNSSHAATTSWVNALGIKPSQIVPISSGLTLTASNAGSMYVMGGSTQYVVTLPTAASVLTSCGFLLTNVSSVPQTISCNGSDTTDSGSTVVLTPGARYCIVSDGTSHWREVFFANEVDPSFTAATNNTPAQGDNSTLCATTAFTWQTGTHYNVQTLETSASTVSLAQNTIGARIVLNSSSAQTITLPNHTSLLVGSTVELVKDLIGATPATINAFDSATVIDLGNGSAAVATFSMNSGDTVSLAWTGTVWSVNGSFLFRKLAFPVTLGLTGSVGSPSGLFRQWGQFTATTGSTPASDSRYEGSVAITFPVVFETNCVHISPVVVDSSGAGQQFTWWISNKTTSGCTINVSCATASRAVAGTWEAVGY
jgi:predicted heme/steroid binding protein